MKSLLSHYNCATFKAFMAPKNYIYYLESGLLHINSKERKIKIFQTNYLDMMKEIREALSQSVFIHLTIA